MQKRIGIIMGRCYQDVNRLQLSGILDEAFFNGVSAYVFTLTEETPEERATIGEENLFNIINFSLLDGVIFLPYTFASMEYWSFIERFLQENCPLPIVRIRMESKPFTSIWFHDRAEMAEVTRHLIQVHGCRKLICLTGAQDSPVALERLAGFQDALKEAEIPFHESNVFYGDFWVYSAQELAQEIADGTREKPDGIVCANDSMAISLCDALTEHGFSVPEEIRVTGYDGSTESELHIPPVTTFYTSWKQLGRNAFSLLRELITGESIAPHIQENGVLCCRESCGCHNDTLPMNHKTFNLQRLESDYLDTNLSTKLLSCNSLDSLVHTMYEHTFIFLESEYVDHCNYILCLCTDWDKGGFNGETGYRIHSYSSQMLQTDYLGNHGIFPLSEMVPKFLQKKPEPSVTFFTAVHFLDRCFGYSVLRYQGIADSFTPHYLRFCREVNNALEFLRVQNALKSLAYHNLLTQIRDTMTGLYNMRSLPNLWEDYRRQARMQNEQCFWIAFSINGLYRLTEAYGSLEKDKLIVAFAEQLQNICSHKEKCLRAGDGDFLILGSEPVNSRCHHLLIQDIKEQFEQYQKVHNQNYLPLQYAMQTESAMHFTSDKVTDSAIALLSKAKSTPPTYSEQLHYEDLTELRRNIYKYPEREWTLATCSGQLNISSSYFHRIYQKAFGVSCASDIRRSKLEHAKWLLLHTSDTLQEIARKCGYDYSHFMRTFKREYGITPTEYRRGKTES